MPILYDYLRAPSPRRARIVLAEKGIAHDTAIVDLAAGEQLAEGFRAVNPACTVPALLVEDGAPALTDNAAILAWAEAVKPEPPLLGRTPLDKAEIASWNARIEHDCFIPIAEAMRNTAPAMKDRALPGPVNYAQIPQLAERGRARLFDFLDRFDTHLAGREYVAASGFSVADITAAVAIDFARVLRFDPTEGRPNIAAWRARLAERPAFSL
ncbi:glutathione S-transferase family protein [Novosphingobium sp.]|uniref:glutathione S-transferase family protein n=1 Tax=Novosphingobium sp. TaxID=1874826 RepID=UPI002733E4C0|nr:glutathione binding-like protein [Novosphingobium sp.]MDP3907024.1 glutathione binding-like protein [Novosphingobium sp.]